MLRETRRNDGGASTVQWANFLPLQTDSHTMASSFNCYYLHGSGFPTKIGLQEVP